MVTLSKLQTICLGACMRVSRGHYRDMDQAPHATAAEHSWNACFQIAFLTPCFAGLQLFVLRFLLRWVCKYAHIFKVEARQTTQNINATSKLQRLAQGSFFWQVVRLSRVSTWVCLSIKLSHKHNTGQLMVIRAKIMSITSNYLCVVRNKHCVFTCKLYKPNMVLGDRI